MAATAWQAQAGWYDERHGERGDDLHAQVVVPAVLRRLALRPGQRVLDCCCGTGVIARALALQGAAVVGVDAAEALLTAARQRAGEHERYLLGDAGDLRPVLAGERFDHACIVLALQDLDPIEPVLAGIAAHLPVGGRLVIVLVHPCFRPLRQSRWGWDEGDGIRYRRIDAYAQDYRVQVQTHPSQGRASPTSTAFHRPLSTYVNALGSAGFGLVALDEPLSPRRGSPGKRQAAEDRSQREIPVFAVLTAQRLG